jgi:hypothetical protein
MVNMERISALDDAESLAKEMAAILAKLPGEWLIAECAMLSIFSAAKKGSSAHRLDVMKQFDAFVTDPGDPDVMAKLADVLRAAHAHDD